MQMMTNTRNEKKGLTVLELLVAIAVIAILAVALVPTMNSFNRGRELETAAVKLLGDLRQTHQFARVQRDGYKYYGLRFYGSLGEGNDCDGYKIVRYEPPGGVEPMDFTPPVDFDNVTVIKGSDSTDNPEFLEDTFFGKSVVIDADSEFDIILATAKPDSIVFTPQGSATRNGDVLLTGTTDDIVLSVNADTKKTITIVPLTGNVRLQ